MNVTRNIIDVCTFQLQASLGLHADTAGGGAAFTRGIRSRNHSANPRSRLVNISSHVGSMRIGVPHIRIEDGSRVWGGTVS